jgi:hypothetical protein
MKTAMSSAGSLPGFLPACSNPPVLPPCEGEFAVYFSRIASILGIAHVRTGDFDKGLSLLEEAANRAQAIGFLFGLGLVLAQLGEAHLIGGGR